MRSVLRGATAADRNVKDPAFGTPLGSRSGGEDAGLELWCIQTLVEQLNHGEPVIVNAVIAVLEEAAQDDRCLRALVGD